LRTLSRQKDFEAADVAFIGVNLIDVPELERSFPLEGESMIMLFEGDRAEKNADGSDVKLVGFIDKDAIENFIEEHFGAAIYQARKQYQYMKREQYAQSAQTIPVETQPTVIYQEPAYQTVPVVYSDNYYGGDYYSPGYYGGGFGPGLGIGFGVGWGARGWGGRGWGGRGGGHGWHGGGGHRGGGGGRRR
jgi:hypothetical protein